MLKILRHYWPVAKHYKCSFSVMIIGMVCVVALETAIPFFIRDFVNLLAEETTESGELPQNMQNILFTIISLYAGLWILWRINDFAIVHFESNGMRDLDNLAFSVLQRQSMRFFQESFTGSLVKKMGRFIRAFEHLTDIFFFNFYREFLSISALLVIFMLERPIMGIAFFIWANIFLIGNATLARWKLKYEIKVAKADSRVGACAADSLSNNTSVKIFARENDEAKRFAEVADDRFKIISFVWKINNYINAVQAFFMLGFELFFFFLAARWWQEGIFTAGDFIFFQAYLIGLFRMLWEFGNHIRRTFEDIANATEMIDIIENKIEVMDKPGAIPLKILKGAIEFRNVTFSFEGKKLFDNFSLKIPGGQKVALVGPSGAGKTTITKILFRFFDIENGAIFIDGQNITDVTQESLRRNISLVPQTPDLFHRTLTENITFGRPDARQEEIEWAAKMSRSYDFIKTFSKQYETLVGERGVKLSGGQKQRIAIACAFIENAPILVLDEATSALDSIVEGKIQDALLKLMEGRTTIVIAHRLSTILKMDRIVVICDGKIVEDDTHKELLKKKQLYADMWSHQIGGFLKT